MPWTNHPHRSKRRRTDCSLPMRCVHTAAMPSLAATLSQAFLARAGHHRAQAWHASHATLPSAESPHRSSGDSPDDRRSGSSAFTTSIAPETRGLARGPRQPMDGHQTRPATQCKCTRNVHFLRVIRTWRVFSADPLSCFFALGGSTRCGELWEVLRIGRGSRPSRGAEKSSHHAPEPLPK